MNPELGRYLENRMLSTTNLIKTMYDIGMGQGKDVVFSIQGKELVFERGEAPTGEPGFVRVLPTETWLIVSFPRGREISDPLNRLKGPPGSRLRTYVRESIEIDPYLRRMIAAAYSLE